MPPQYYQYKIFLFRLFYYMQNKVNWVLLFVGIVSLIVYIFWFPYKYEVSSKGLYGITTHYRWIPYFAAMLLGAVVGMKRKDLKYHAG